MFYLTTTTLPVFVPLGIIGIYRWYWYFVKLIAYLLYKPINPDDYLESRKYLAQRDVTVIIPTVDTEKSFSKTLASIISNKPNKIIVITTNSEHHKVQNIINSNFSLDSNIIQLLSVQEPNKRIQLALGAQLVKTRLTAFCDDDVIWTNTLLEWALAPFECDPRMGGVGTSQHVIPLHEKASIWEIMADYRLSMRNIELAATTYIDGGACCLSGRTSIYRSDILQDPRFQSKFTTEKWRNKYLLQSGDDKFITRWLYNHNWNMHIQCDKKCDVGSSFKDDWSFLKQIIRWSRNTWRSDLKSLFSERFVWKRYPFVAYTMLDKCINPITLLIGPSLVLYICISGVTQTRWWVILLSYCAWLIITRTIKYIPHFTRKPWHIFAVPLWVIFNICFAILKIYSLFTLSTTGWGTRNIDNIDIYTIANQQINIISTEKESDDIIKLKPNSNIPEIKVYENIGQSRKEKVEKTLIYLVPPKVAITPSGSSNASDTTLASPPKETGIKFSHKTREQEQSCISQMKVV